MVIWLTGISNSGKSTIARELELRLLAAGHNAYVLDSDELRENLCDNLSFGRDDRRENVRRVAHLANHISNVMDGYIIIAMIAPFEEDRDMAYGIMEFEDNRVFEVYLKCSVASCRHRDKKGLYEKWDKGEIKGLAGVDHPYDVPTNPDLVLETDVWSLEQCVDILTSRLSHDLL